MDVSAVQLDDSQLVTLKKETIRDRDKNLAGLLQRCEQQNIHLNHDKIKFRMNEVPFIGHVATKDGLSVDPCKVQAIWKCQSLLMWLQYDDSLVSKQVSASLI